MNYRNKSKRIGTKKYGSGRAFLCVVALLIAAMTVLSSCGGSEKAPAKSTASDISYEPISTDSADTASDTAEAVTTTPPAPVDDPADFPPLNSQSGTYYSDASGLLHIDDRVLEVCGYDEDTAANYASLVSKAADALAGSTNVYCLLIPTAYGIVVPDDIKPQLDNYYDQSANMNDVFSKMSANVIKANCFNHLMMHRDEYVYFRTDHHWTQLGAYYAYETFCQAKGVEPYTLDQRELSTFDGFYGTLAQDGQAPDTVFAYHPHSQTATMQFTDKNGTTLDWPIIMDVSDWAASSKYNTFAAGDNPMTVFTNPEVTDGSVGIIVKESYGNALLPLIVDHYATVYEIDYRYWQGNLISFANEVGAKDLIFANNMMMVSSILVGDLSTVIN